MASQLVFIKWYCKQAVYLNGELVYYGESVAHNGLLQALGYSCSDLFEVPTHNIPSEYAQTRLGHWEPPKRLVDLQKQREAAQRRERIERIEILKIELRELQKEEEKRKCPA